MSVKARPPSVFFDKAHELSANFVQGLEVVKQLLQQSTTPHRFVLGCRDTTATESAYEAIKYDDKKHSVSILPLNLSNLKSVKSFAHESLQQVGSNKLDYVLLNAGMSKDANELGPNGSQWCEPLVVNHLCEFRW